MSLRDGRDNGNRTFSKVLYVRSPYLPPSACVLVIRREPISLRRTAIRVCALTRSLCDTTCEVFVFFFLVSSDHFICFNHYGTYFDRMELQPELDLWGGLEGCNTPTTNFSRQIWTLRSKSAIRDKINDLFFLFIRSENNVLQPPPPLKNCIAPALTFIEPAFFPNYLRRAWYESVFPVNRCYQVLMKRSFIRMKNSIRFCTIEYLLNLNT